MSKLLEMRGKRNGLMESLRCYLDSDEDRDRLEVIAAWGDYAHSSRDQLSCRLAGNHRWSVCQELDDYYQLCRSIAEEERAQVAALRSQRIAA